MNAIEKRNDSKLISGIKNYLLLHHYEYAEKEENINEIYGIFYGITCLRCNDDQNEVGKIVQVRKKQTELSFYAKKETFFDLNNVTKIKFLKECNKIPDALKKIYKSQVINISINQTNTYYAFQSEENLIEFLRGILFIYKEHLDEDCYERRLWATLDQDDNGYLNTKEFEDFCKKFLKRKDWKAVFDEYDKDKNNMITYDEFQEFIKLFTSGEEYTEIFNEFSKDGNYIKFFDLKRFLLNYQEENLFDKDIANLILNLKEVPTEDYKVQKNKIKSKIQNMKDDFNENDEVLNELKINKKEFKILLESRYSDVLNEKKIKCKLNDNRPINDYYINSSHNTYLQGHQLTGKCNLDMYKLAMEYGCRLVELDCYDGSGTNIKITHSYCPVGIVNVRDCYKKLRENAFLYSPYPVILSVENHLSEKYQIQMASDTHEILKDLFVLDLNNLPIDLPPLKKMKNKFIIKCGGKRPKGPDRKTCKQRKDMVYEEDLKDNIKKNPHLYAFGLKAILNNEEYKEKIKQEKKLNHETEDINNKEIVKRLVTDLIDKSHPKQKDEEENDEMLKEEDEKEYGEDLLKIRGFIGCKFLLDRISEQNYQPYEFVTIKDKMFPKFCEDFSTRRTLSKFTTVTLMKAYPTSFSSANYDPIKVWQIGGQVAALNIQTLEEDYTLINKIFFMQNENVGYVLKPKKLLPESLYFEKYEKSKGVLEIKVYNITEISELIEKYNMKVKKSTDIKLEFQLYGSVKDDSNPIQECRVTGTLINPEIENSKIKFEIYDAELSCIVIRLKYSGYIIGRSAIPLCMLKKGIRRVSLYDKNQVESQGCAIIASFQHQIDINY